MYCKYRSNYTNKTVLQFVLRSTSRGNAKGSIKKQKPMPKMVDQESQTNSSDILIPPLETYSPTKEIINSNTKGSNPLMGTSSFTKNSVLVLTNDDDADDYDPLYAIPNHRVNNNGKEINTTPILHSSYRGEANGSFPPRRTSSERTPKSNLHMSKNSPPNSLPISASNANPKYNLERSQSLRISRKSLRSLSSASKGGSLR